MIGWNATLIIGAAFAGFSVGSIIRRVFGFKAHANGNSSKIASKMYAGTVPVGAVAVMLVLGFYPAGSYMRSRDGCIYVQRSPDGFYNLVGQLNGSHIGFVVEVGARYIVLNQDGAKAAGFPVNLLSYSQRIQTANGQTQVAPIVLERLIVGGIKEQSINAVVAKEGELTTNILGMSFLDKLQSYGVRGEELFMCAYV